MHYYKKNIGDYHKKAGRLSMLEHGAYTLLLDSCYDREHFPTLDEALDWTWARTDEEVQAVKFVLSKFFVKDGEIYVQKRAQEELEAYKAKSETNTRIAKEREDKRKIAKLIATKQARNVNETCENLNESPPNHKPITNNHKPILKTHTLSENENSEIEPDESQNWQPDSEILLNVIRQSVGVQAQSVLAMPEYNFHLGNFNAHWENKIDLTENQRTRKFAAWLIQEFKKTQDKPQHFKNSRQPEKPKVNRNVNDAHGEIPHHAPAVDDLDLRGVL